jgi:putative sigma-54 modulation protein
MISIEVRSKTDDMESLIREFAERRIGFALDHLSNLRRIAISIEDVNGPKGGADKHCRIIAELGFTSLVLDETQPDWQSAVARAIHRLDRKATQELQRVNRSGLRSAHRTHFRTSTKTKTKIESENDPGSKPNTQTD